MGLFSFKRQQAEPLPPLRFTNTLSGEVEEFVPLSNKTVKMYNCGPTLYGTQHIGNMRAAVFADILRRTLEHWGYQVQQVINLTDFGHLTSDADEGDDKMSTGLKLAKMALTLDNMAKLADKYQQEYFDDIDALNVVRSKITFPRASHYIPEQIALISSLEQKGYAYATKQGVYYDVSRFPAYGKLGGINLEGQREGARVAENTEKRGPFDFVLWKSDKKLGWTSPWNKGFPGWHIECTAMIFKLLGKQIDIHTGGIEHIPVHHNNEIAQAEAASGKQFVKYWLHNDHITIDGKKISKSLGNTVYLHNIIDKGYSPIALRYWFLTAHYRSPANFTWDAVVGADTALNRLRRAFLELPTTGADLKQDGGFMATFNAALADDLNTAKALATVWDLMKNTEVSPATKRALLVAADEVLGLGLAQSGPTAKLALTAEAIPAEVQKLVDDREAARTGKDFARADELRQAIDTAGFELADTPEGPKVTPK
ncbi:MAG: cysS [Candidatus Adlerbacteria bacterium]|nr:cysS [Candidatus Adlerbacteria bacterium]